MAFIFPVRKIWNNCPGMQRQESYKQLGKTVYPLLARLNISFSIADLADFQNLSNSIINPKVGFLYPLLFQIN